MGTEWIAVGSQRGPAYRIMIALGYDFDDVIWFGRGPDGKRKGWWVREHTGRTLYLGRNEAEAKEAIVF